MAIYRFTALDNDGLEIVDQIEASSVEEARRRFEHRCMKILKIEAVDAAGGQGRAAEMLSTNEAGQLAEHVAQLSAANLPLGAGLRAAADESDNPKLATALSWLAGQIEQGRPIEEALMSSSDRLPRHVSGLIAAAARTGQLGTALAELVEHQRAARSLRRGILSGLSYPLVVTGLAAGLFLFLMAFLPSHVEKIFKDFGTSLPVLTQVFLWWHHVGIWMLIGLVGVIVVVLLLVRWRLGVAGWHRLLVSVPILGSLWQGSGLVEWSGLLGVLVRHQIPLLDALRLAAGGVSNANVARLSLALADGVARGRTLSQMMSSLRQVPASLVPLVYWGEKSGDLAGSLGAGRELLEERVRTRSLWLQMILPPVLFIAIGCAAAFIAGSLFMPMINLLTCLGGGGG